MAHSTPDAVPPMAAATAGTVDAGEIARFEAIAAQWWDPHGPFRPLHRLNPVRQAFLRDRLARHFGLDGRSVRPLSGLSLLDIGCGGGLISEPMARLGADVTGIDASEKNVTIAAVHADTTGVPVTYRATTAEDLTATGRRWDAVLALEIVEHVADLPVFLGAVGSLVRPGGIAVLSTLNRTLRSYAMAIVGAEYVLRWLPRGTHKWSKFVRPSELATGLEAGGLRMTEVTGLIYNPLLDEWSQNPDVAVNYMAVAVRPG